MSAKEKYLRRLLLDAEFYLNNIDNDDPSDLIGDATCAGRHRHPVDAAMSAAQKNEESKAGKADNEVSL
jgi:hypothetical protein